MLGRSSYSIRHNSSCAAFTLVELLIVLGIISTLITISIVSFRTAQVRARDTERISDIRQYQNSLEIFANKNNSLYPTFQSPIVASSVLCPVLEAVGCPEDPRPASAGIAYQYYSDGAGIAGSPTATSYVLYAELEGSSDYWVACSDGRSGKIPTTSSITPPGCPL